MTELSADDARKIAHGNFKWSELARKFFTWVRNESENGNFFGNFYTGGKHFDAYELDEIEKLGYKLSWNSTCLWYNVHWTT